MSWLDGYNGIITTIRFFFSLFDMVTYWVVEIAFDLMFKISKVNIFGEGLLQEFSKRIFLMLGIFMIFKLTLSLINAVVNPDKLSDKETGMSKIISRILLALIMLVSVNTAFRLSREAQEIFLPIVPRVFIGVANSDDIEVNSAKVGQDISLTTYKTFVTLNEQCPNAAEQESTLNLKSGSDLARKVNERCIETPSVYLYNYFPIISFIVGGFLAFIVVGFCIDIAVRVFKLGILELMAPIPIVSYIDPKSSKDGAFSSWLKSCIKTYTELFLKLGIMYFVIFLVGMILSKEGNVSGITGPFVLIFVIIGLFKFAKDAPKFIMNTIGIKDGDSGFLGKAAKFAWNKTGGAGIETAGGALGGAYAGFRTGGVKGAVAGATFGARKGFQAGWDGKSGSFLDSGNKVLQTALGNPKAKMGLLGGTRFSDNLNAGSASKKIKDNITSSSDAKNQQRLDKLDKKYGRDEEFIFDKFNEKENEIRNSNLDNDKKEELYAKNYKQFNKQQEHYTAKRTDIENIKTNRANAKKQDDQAKLLTKALEDAKLGGDNNSKTAKK